MLRLPKTIKIKEIIRHDDDMFLLTADLEFQRGWAVETTTECLRVDMKVLSELLRFENPSQTDQIENLVVTMATLGIPPIVDIKALTGEFLEVRHCELVLTGSGEQVAVLDVFAKRYHEPLGTYVNLETEFSKEIVELAFTAFRKAFYLIERGYTKEEAALLTETNNPIAVLIYQKLESALSLDEVNTVEAKKQEEVLVENFNEEKWMSKNSEYVPF